MAALLDRIRLRRRRPAASYSTVPDAAAHPLPSPGIGRPRLIAIWQAGPDGRLACAWSASIGAPDIPAE